MTTKLPKELAEEIFTKHSKEFCEELVEILESKLRATKATIYYSGDLNSEMQKQLKTWVTKTFGKTATPEFIEDPSIIAGIKVTHKDMTYDMSLLGELK